MISNTIYLRPPEALQVALNILSRFGQNQKQTGSVQNAAQLMRLHHTPEGVVDG